MTDTTNNWHTLDVDETLRVLGTSRSGLGDEDVRLKLDQYGPNELGPEERVSHLELITQQLASPLVYVLFAATIISFAVGEMIDGFVILGIVIINTGIGFFQEFRAEKAVQALRKLAAPKALVIRNGERREINATDLVPGDIIVLATGDRIPADSRIVESSNLKSEEAALTGESQAVEKFPEPLPPDTPLAERTNMVYSGTTVVYGRSEAAVVATGLSTEVGKIAQEVASLRREPTPLQERLAALGRILAVVALALALVVLIAGLARGIAFFDIFLFAIASAVASIPEGLPAVVTIVLAIGLQRMAARNAIIRKLPAVETLGSATVICSDKTGTLTKNEMTVKSLYTYGREYHVTGEGYEPQGEVTYGGEPADLSETPVLRKMLVAAVLCNDADLRECEDSHCEISGDPTEAALITAGEKAGLSRRQIRESMPRVDEIPFDSQRAYMATLNDSPGGRTIFAKGAPEKLLALCSKIMLDSEVKELTPELEAEIAEVNKNLASKALRILAFAYKEYDESKNNATSEDLKDGLVFLGLAGMIDPPRPEAIEAVERCGRAGIEVIMATGDNKITAGAIAKQMGILEEGEEVVEGRDVARMSDDELTERIDDIAVFARVEPEHKLRIVKALKRRDNIVAMTGDGVNDAPALKRADIGVAMGITGTDVAKEASEMVLADDNFASIVGAVEEGRIIFNNIKKVVSYLLSTNAGEQLIIVATILLGFPLPLTAVQILWVNLVTDSFPSLALAADPSREDVLARPPRSPQESIVSRDVVIRIVIIATIMAIGTISLFSWALDNNGLRKAQTVAFATMALFQLVNAFNMRSPNASIFKIGLFSNMWLVWGVIISLALQVIAIHLPLFNKLFGTVPLTGMEWLIIAVVSSTVLWTGEIRKLVFRVESA